ncbi:MAG: AAA domain-containing protein [bacterium]|nr:AAA domain-containing protein [bacterium]
MNANQNPYEHLNGVHIAVLCYRGKSERPFLENLGATGCRITQSNNLKELSFSLSRDPAKLLVIELSQCEDYHEERKKQNPSIENLGSEILVIATEGKTEEAAEWARTLQGYFLTIPAVTEEIAILLERVLDANLLKNRLARYETTESMMERFGSIVVKSPEMIDVIRLARMLARRDDAILFTGPAGSGKEHLAQLIHEHSVRRHGPFLSINCRAFEGEELAGELFGRGEKDKNPCLAEQASGGTLYLDDISAAAPEVQGKLLRFIENGAYKSPEGKGTRKSDVRVFAGTSQQLGELAAAGEFSEELFFLLNRFTVALPALRRRIEDIPILAREMLARLSRERGEEPIRITEETMKALMEHAWPGNLRELENVLTYALQMAGKNAIEPIHLPKQFHDEVGSLFISSSEDDLPTMSEIERRYILKVMEATGNNKVKAAAILDINRATLHRKLQIYESQKLFEVEVA